MKFQIATLSILGLGLLIMPAAALAGDIDVTCSSGGPCSLSPANTPLFNTTNMAPGQSVTRTVDVTNNTDDVCEIGLELDNASVQPQGFGSMLFTLLDSNGSLYGTSDGSGGATNDKTLDDLFNDGVINFGDVSDGDTRTYEWTVTFDTNAGNNYQGATFNFDFDMVFECLESSNPDDGRSDDQSDQGPDPDSPQPSSTPEGQVAGATTSGGGPTIGGSVLGAASLAQTGTFFDKLMYWVLVSGLILTALSTYGLIRNRFLRDGSSA